MRQICDSRGLEAQATSLRGGEVVVPCTDLDAALALVDALGFRLEEADAFTVPAGRPFELAAADADLEWLLVIVP